MAAAAAEAAAAALPGADALQEQEHQPLVLDGTIADMAAAVQRGDFAAAEAAGGSAALPLSLPRGCLSGLAPIFEGAQASVYSAQLRPASLLAVGAPNVSSSGGGGTDSLAVAVKKPRIRETADLERFRREVALLGRLRHAHIVCLLGARLLPPDYLAVLALEHTNAAEQLHTAGWRPGWAQLLRLGAQLAAAVAHIHAAGFVHRDIKPANLLLDAARRTARLADLGLAAAAAELAAATAQHAKPTGGFHKQHMVGTLEYMAPEVLLKQPHSFASDVWALAVTLNELAAGALPYSDCTRDNPLAHTVLEMGYGRQELAAAVAAEGLRPTLRADTPPRLAALLRACWARQPGERPAAADVARQLAALAAEAAAAEAAAVPAPLPASNGGLAAEAQTLQQLQGENGAAPLVPGLQPAAANGSSSSSSPGAAAWLARLEGAPAPLPVGSFLTAGRRDRMEDTVTVLQDLFAPAGFPGCTALGVFDGHRGAAAAEYLAARLQGHLEGQLGASSSGGDLLRRALLAADAGFRAQDDAEWAARVARMGAPAAGARPAPGATASLVLLYPAPAAPAGQPGGGASARMLAVANLGDSRVVLCRDGAALELTRDHTADLPDERQRVAAAGGACSVRAGGWRVGDAGLQVTRSIGDADLKGQGVTAEAELAELALQRGDAFLIAATDGLWERVGSAEAVGLVQDTVKHPAMCAQRLVTEALARGGGDNVACLVALLDPDASTAERVYHQGRLKYGAASAARPAAAVSADELRDTY